MFSELIEKLQRREDLTADEAATAMGAIMDGRATSAQIAGLLIGLAISLTAEKSPSEAIGKPASIMSTPSDDSCCAIFNFSSMRREKPGACSPSRSVVSKIVSRLVVVMVGGTSYLVTSGRTYCPIYTCFS